MITAAEDVSTFAVVADGHYRLSFPAIGIEFDVDRLRRAHGELHCELAVSCNISGARTTDGCLSVGAFNLSSPRARQDRAKFLTERSKANAGWLDKIEELCQRVLAAERVGQPADLLKDLPLPAKGEHLDVHGLRLLKTLPVIVFGDGGAGKSLLALFIAGTLAQRGMRVLYADWELSGEDHRDRLERIFGAAMPDVWYARCDRPMSVEADRLRRLRQKHEIDYMVSDSIGFGCDGPPEAAEVAGTYFRALRQIGCGSLNLAHITKGENGDQRPFGSTFWHNGARATWFAKLVSTSADETQKTIGLFNRKANLGPVMPPVGIHVTFSTDRIDFKRVDLATVDELADRLAIWQRMRTALVSGPMTPAELASELGEKAETVTRTARRMTKVFTKLTNAKDGVHRIALVSHREVA